MFSDRFDQLVQALRILPSVGPKSAQRMALHLIMKNREGAIGLAHALTEATDHIHECSICHSLTEDEVCNICTSLERDDELLCVVELLQRLSQGQIKEVILATNATVEGQATAHYLVEASKHLPVQMTRIAQGVPQGGELEYVDSHTLSQAVHNRMRIK